MGIAIIIIGLALSIGLHEFGHLIPAKLFGVRVPNWAIGFGPKLLSKKIGETEYSLRLIPLGGFITMIGMYPPDYKGKDEKRPFSNVIKAARAAHADHMEPGDAGKRTLYSIAAWKRMIVMFGGPFVNLVLGVSLLTGVSMNVGTVEQSTKVHDIVKCMQEFSGGTCDGSSDPTPAVIAGLKAGDQVVQVNGIEVKDYSALQAQLKASAAQLEMTVLRNGSELNLEVPEAYANIGSQNHVRVIGVRFENKHVEVGFSEAFGNSIGAVGQTFGVIGNFPAQIYQAAESTFAGKERDPNGAISIVGLAQASSQVDSLAYWLYLLGSLNIALFVFNMIPLPPLDGGHIAGAIYEYLKRSAYRLLGKKDPGPVDTALMAPIAQMMFIVLFLAGILMMFADVVNPISF